MIFWSQNTQPAQSARPIPRDLFLIVYLDYCLKILPDVKETLLALLPTLFNLQPDTNEYLVSLGFHLSPWLIYTVLYKFKLNND